MTPKEGNCRPAERTFHVNPSISPYFESIQAGFPSPAEGYIEKTLNLHDIVVRNPANTFFVRVSGHSMKGEGIDNNDIVVVDKSLPPMDGKIAVCCLNQNFTLKKLRVRSKRVWLVPANSEFKTIELQEGDELTIWGIVVAIIKLRR